MSTRSHGAILRATMPSSSMPARNTSPGQSGRTLNLLAPACQQGQDQAHARRLLVATSALAWATLTAIVLASPPPPEESLANGSGLLLALQAGRVQALFAAGVVVLTRRARPLAGSLLIASGLAFNAQALPVPDAGGTVLFTLALVLVAAAAPLAGRRRSNSGREPSRRRERRARRDRCERGCGSASSRRRCSTRRRPDASAVPGISCSCTVTRRCGRMCSTPGFVGSRHVTRACIALLTYAARGAMRHWNASPRTRVVDRACRRGNGALARSHCPSCNHGHTVRVAWIVECSGLALLGTTSSPAVRAHACTLAERANRPSRPAHGADRRGAPSRPRSKCRRSFARVGLPAAGSSACRW